MSTYNNNHSHGFRGSPLRNQSHKFSCHNYEAYMRKLFCLLYWISWRSLQSDGSALNDPHPIWSRLFIAFKFRDNRFATPRIRNYRDVKRIKLRSGWVFSLKYRPWRPPLFRFTSPAIQSSRKRHSLLTKVKPRVILVWKETKKKTQSVVK